MVNVEAKQFASDFRVLSDQNGQPFAIRFYVGNGL